MRAVLYLDDLITYGKTLEGETERLIEVLDRLWEHRLKLRGWLKCSVGYENIS